VSPPRERTILPAMMPPGRKTSTVSGWEGIGFRGIVDDVDVKEVVEVVSTDAEEADMGCGGDGLDWRGRFLGVFGRFV